jgi:GntR family transcriptional regulator, transcriptional repressor for pyruvate dehydrogenase complex
MFKNIKINRISDEISFQIKQMVLKNELQSGNKLPTELELAEMFSVSRTAVREALCSLEAQGLIERKKSGGTVIKQFTANKILESIIFAPKNDLQMFADFMEARKVLESQIVVLAIERSQVEDLELIQQSLSNLEVEIIQKGNGVESDIMFHLSLAACTHNQVLISVIKSISDMLRTNREKTLQYPGRLLECLKEHRAIFAAIKSKHTIEAQRLIVFHLDQALHIAHQIY